MIKKEITNISNKIQNLKISNVTLENNDLILVKHKLLLTMIDEKVYNVVSDNRSVQKCYICEPGDFFLTLIYHLLSLILIKKL